jgi:exodeoxyribonuclease-5
MQLTNEQKHIIRELLKFSKPITSLGGYAGTGKTVVVSHLSKLLPNFAVCAFTGKAANVLRKKGISYASTIHSLIYKPYTDEKGNVYFSLAYDLDCEGIIVDEASMVSRELYKDLKYFGKPSIFVGDHGQLEPVADKFNLMEKPDYVLETIHRNAGEIAHFAEYVRNGYRPAAWAHRNPGKKVKFIDKREYEDLILKVDQVICAYNKTRAEINIIARQQLGRISDKPVVGDRVMCLRNNNILGLFNGMQGTVVNVFKRNRMIFEAENGRFEVKYDPDVFNQVKYEYSMDREDPNPFDYCWGVTCHKAQGDEWDKGLVLEQKCELWEHSRWAYTAGSRFKQLLCWVAA